MNLDSSAKNGLLLRGAPEALGMSSQNILDFIDAIEAQELELHSLMVLRRGQVAAEGWWAPYRADRVHLLWSLSKSFTSTAIGLAVDQGLLDVDDAVISFFPEDRPAKAPENLAAMKVHHLLAMCTGHAEDTVGRITGAADGNWVRQFLSLPVEHAPGSLFVYNSGATYMLSAILQKVTGRTVMEYLSPRLFEPLGIEDITWETCPRGINTGGWGLSIHTEDIARFGQFYLQKGMWNGKQLLSTEWVERATSKQIENAKDLSPAEQAINDWAQGYGYQFWRCQHGGYRGDGAFGQYCIVLPEQEAVIAVTAGISEMQPFLDLVWRHLLPAFTAESALPENPAARAALEARLAQLQVPTVSGATTSRLAGRWHGKVINFKPNPARVEALAFDFGEKETRVAVQDRLGRHRLTVGMGEWRDTSTVLFDPWENDNQTPLDFRMRPAAACGAWEDEKTFVFKVQFVLTPFCYTLRVRFEGDMVKLSARVNASFGERDYPPLEGKIE